jgi:hypothetical protein
MRADSNGHDRGAALEAMWAASERAHVRAQREANKRGWI